MFDDFDLGPQSDESIDADEYDEWNRALNDFPDDEGFEPTEEDYDWYDSQYD